MQINIKKLCPGVLSGSQWQGVNQTLKEKQAALPAVCISSTQTANAVLAAAAEVNSPVIVLTSFGGGHAAAGKTLPKDPEIWARGAESLALHVHTVAEDYGVPVILATDHCQLENRAWLDSMIEINDKWNDLWGKNLWSGHMADFSALPLKEALKGYKFYLEHLSKRDLLLEFELGQTGGEEDGISGNAEYTNPNDVETVYRALIKISDLFTAALTFGNVHGVYKGDFALEPDILRQCQERIQEVFKTGVNPLDLVFHGGSGCTKEQMKAALQFGTIKQNIDTDTQWAFTGKGVVPYIIENRARLQSQIGFPGNPDEPNKKIYDPRGMMFEAEKAMTERVVESFYSLNAVNLCG